ncbi:MULTISPECIES: WD40/YVTN/BNR-like repeat-containing protein [Bacteria]
MLPWVVGGAAVAVAGAAVAGALVAGGAGQQASPAPYVGGDLHVLAATGGGLFVGGHDGAAASADGGKTWAQLESLEGGDPMGWAETTDGFLVGGHPGLYSSADGESFTLRTGQDAVSDVHGIGAAGDTVYLASTQAGLLASSDGGDAWEVRNPQVGQSVMGTILVDPDDSQRLVAPDMMNGLLLSEDGGLTWTVLGGAEGPMAAAWDPRDRNRIVSVGMSGGTVTSDGGATWSSITLPTGASAVAFSALIHRLGGVSACDWIPGLLVAVGRV